MVMMVLLLPLLHPLLMIMDTVVMLDKRVPVERIAQQCNDERNVAAQIAGKLEQREIDAVGEDLFLSETYGKWNQNREHQEMNRWVCKYMFKGKWAKYKKQELNQLTESTHKRRKQCFGACTASSSTREPKRGSPTGRGRGTERRQGTAA